MLLRVVARAKDRLARFVPLSPERGATAVEYAIMLALIAAVIVGAVALLGQGTNSGFEKVQFPP
jgi:pilus assembly protein Flp/PilA